MGILECESSKGTESRSGFAGAGEGEPVEGERVGSGGGASLGVGAWGAEWDGDVG